MDIDNEIDEILSEWRKNLLLDGADTYEDSFKKRPLTPMPREIREQIKEVFKDKKDVLVHFTVSDNMVDDEILVYQSGKCIGQVKL